MNRLHIAFADNGGLARIPLIVPEGQGGEPYVPETVQAAQIEAVRLGFASAAPGEWLISDIRRVTDAIEAALRALAQEDTE
jgi:hypothetical protein